MMPGMPALHVPNSALIVRRVCVCVCVFVGGTIGIFGGKCFVCKERRVATIEVDIHTITMGYLHDHILKKVLGVAAPDV